jgi:hypothetical protein
VFVSARRVLVGLTEQPCWGGVRGAILKNTRRSALAERFPHLVESVGISDTRDQMQVSDRLLIDRAITKIVDLGSGTFDLCFAVMAKIDFVPEARRQLVEQLFCSWPIGNRRPRAYADLKRRFKSTIFVLVHNAALSVTFAAQDFLASGIECGPVRIARLSYLVRRVIDRANFSLQAISRRQAEGEVHQWIGPILTRFRELELHLFANRLAIFLNSGNGNNRPNFETDGR